MATAALKRRKLNEQELDRLQGTRFQLEMQVNTLESASFNTETMNAMKQAAKALSDIHGKLYVFASDPHLYWGFLRKLICLQTDIHVRHCNPYSTPETVDSTMAEIQEQTQLANEVSEAISSSTYAGVDLDEVRCSLLW